VMSQRKMLLGGAAAYLLLTLFCRFAHLMPGMPFIPLLIGPIFGPPVILANRSQNLDENPTYLIIYIVGTGLFFFFSMLGIVCWNRRGSYHYQNLGIISVLLAILTWIAFGLVGILPAV
jgi:hypothetical protein